jgi:hypothetical protein
MGGLDARGMMKTAAAGSCWYNSSSSSSSTSRRKLKAPWMCAQDTLEAADGLHGLLRVFLEQQQKMLEEVLQ